MKNIMCFGDSNTYGANPDGSGRFPRNLRWTGILQQLLGDDYYVIEEGMRGRTVAMDDEIAKYNMSGTKQIDVIMHTHYPLDLVVVMLGTNDVKERFNLHARDIACAMGYLVQKILNYSKNDGRVDTKVLIVAPTYVQEEVKIDDYYGNQFEKSRQIAYYYEIIAKKMEVEFISLLDVVKPSDLDGLHFDKEAQQTIAEVLNKKIQEILY